MYWTVVETEDAGSVMLREGRNSTDQAAKIEVACELFDN
jgi:hypothetical protein